MNTRTIFILALVGLSVAGIVSTAYGQNKRVGTSAAPELLIPVGGRDFAMSGASLASTTGLEAVYWNPAGLARTKYSAEAMISTMSYIADINVNYGAVGAPFGDFGVMAISVKSISFGEILLTTNDDPYGLGGRVFNPTFVTVAVSYSRLLSEFVSVGGNVKLITEQIDRVSASGVAFDFGVQYSGLGGVSGLGIGVAVKNIGTQMKFDGSGLLRDAQASEGQRPTQKYKSEAGSFELPALVEIGLSYTRSVADNTLLTVNSSFANNSLYLDEYRLGGEVSYKLEGVDLFARLGVAIIPKGQNLEQENPFGPTYGFGLLTDAGGVALFVDYVFRPADLFESNHTFSIRFGF